MFFFTGNFFEKGFKGRWILSKFFTGYSKISRVTFSGNLCFPEKRRSCSVRRVFFSPGDVPVANCKDTLLVLGGKVQNLTRLMPKAVLTKTGGINGKAPKPRLCRQIFKVQPTEDYWWEPPLAVIKTNTCRWCHQQKKAYLKGLTFASSFSVVSTIPRVARIYIGANWLGGSKLTGWERSGTQPPPSRQFLNFTLNRRYCKFA